MPSGETHFKPTNILVPIDFSPSSDVALATAEDLAHQFQARVLLLHVVTAFPVTTGMEFPTTFYPREELLERSQKRSEALLRASVASLTAKGLQASSTVVVGEDVPGNVLAVVDREHIELVVLSTHGMSGWKPIIFGSTAEQIVKLLQCPLLLLHSAEPATASRL